MSDALVIAPSRATGRRWISGRGKAMLAAPACLYLALFFVTPLLLSGVTSFSGADGGFDAARYVSLLTDSYYLGVIATTFKVSLLVSLACIVAGFPIAYVLAYHAGRYANLLIFVLITPLFTSTIMRVFGWQVIFARRGLLNGLLAELHLIDRPVGWLQSSVSVYVALIHVLVPFAVLSIAAVLKGIDPKLKEAAHSMGVSRINTFLFVILPLSLDGIATGAAITFLLASGAFVPMLLLGNGTVVTLPVLIYQQVALRSDFSYASAMANILMVVALIILFIQLRFLRRSGVK